MGKISQKLIVLVFTSILSFAAMANAEIILMGSDNPNNIIVVVSPATYEYKPQVQSCIAKIQMNTESFADSYINFNIKVKNLKNEEITTLRENVPMKRIYSSTKDLIHMKGNNSSTITGDLFYLKKEKKFHAVIWKNLEIPGQVNPHYWKISIYLYSPQHGITAPTPSPSPTSTAPKL